MEVMEGGTDFQCLRSDNRVTPSEVSDETACKWNKEEKKRNQHRKTRLMERRNSTQHTVAVFLCVTERKTKNACYLGFGLRELKEMSKERNYREEEQPLMLFIVLFDGALCLSFISTSVHTTSVFSLHTFTFTFTCSY